MPEVKAPAIDPVKSLTQHQSIVAMMCKNHNKEWWLPQDFMQPGEFFVGYEASARLSELQRENPTMFESQRAGKYMKRKINFDTGKEWYPNISKELQLMVKRYYDGGKS